MERYSLCTKHFQLRHIEYPRGEELTYAAVESEEVF